MKLDPSKDYYDQEFGWVGHPECGNPAEIEQLLIDNRYELDIIGGIQDNDASYSYDDWALVKLKNDYFLVSTSGCSCPSPSETWHVEIGPATIIKIREHVVFGDYDGYTLPKKQLNDFLSLLNSAESL